MSVKKKLDTLNKVLVNYSIKKGYFSKKTNKQLVVIMYHGIDMVQSTRYNPRFFSKDNFEEQVALLKKHTNVLTHEDFIAGNLSTDKVNVVITFDDGYLNNYTYALPILDKYNTHAYFFITGMDSHPQKVLWADAADVASKHGKEHSKITLSGIEYELIGGNFINKERNLEVKSVIEASNKSGYAEKAAFVDQMLQIYDFGKNKELDDYWKLMNEDNIRQTSQSNNITIGSHGFYHNDLGSLELPDAKAEVLQSKNYLENIIQKEVNTIAFPNGSYTNALNDTVYDLGLKTQFLVFHKYPESRKKAHIYDRLGLYPYMGNSHEILHQIIK